MRTEVKRIGARYATEFLNSWESSSHLGKCGDCGQHKMVSDCTEALIDTYCRKCTYELVRYWENRDGITSEIVFADGLPKNGTRYQSAVLQGYWETLRNEFVTRSIR